MATWSSVNKPSSTWSSINKPSSTWSDVNKSVIGSTTVAGTPMGLLLVLTYATDITTGGWQSINKN